MKPELQERLAEIRKELMFRHEIQLADIDKEILSVVHKKERIVRQIEKIAVGCLFDELENMENEPDWTYADELEDLLMRIETSIEHSQ